MCEYKLKLKRYIHPILDLKIIRNSDTCSFVYVYLLIQLAVKYGKEECPERRKDYYFLNTY